MAVNDFSATVTLTRGGIDTITTDVVKPDGTVSERIQVVGGPVGAEHDLTDEEKRALAHAIQAQVDANPPAFDTPTLEAVVAELTSRPTYAKK